MRRVLVLGAGYAGLAATQRLARRVPDGTEIVLVSATVRFVERVRLHQVAAGRPVGVHDLRALVPPAVRLVVGRVAELDPGRRPVLVADGTSLACDAVVVALGSGPPFPMRRDGARWPTSTTPAPRRPGSARSPRAHR